MRPTAKPAKTRAARRPPPKLARASATVFAELAKKTRYADPELIGHWPTIAGPDIAALCRPGRILGAREGRTLELIAGNGAAAADLQMRADDLLAKVNRYLGPNAVARIAVRQRNRGKAQPAQTPRNAQPDASPLGEALSSFRNAIARRNNGER